MKVYVVETDVYEQRGISGIYASPQAAMAAHPIPEMRAIPGVHDDPTRYRRRTGGWTETGLGGRGQWDNGFDHGWSATITEYEVKGVLGPERT